MNNNAPVEHVVEFVVFECCGGGDNVGLQWGAEPWLVLVTFTWKKKKKKRMVVG